MLRTGCGDRRANREIVMPRGPKGEKRPADVESTDIDDSEGAGLSYSLTTDGDGLREASVAAPACPMAIGRPRPSPPACVPTA